MVVAAPSTEVALIDAPTALSGFQLVLQLPRSRSQNRQDGSGKWVVHVPMADPDGVPALLVDVQMWLRREQIAETQVRVGDDVYQVHREHAVAVPQQKGINGL